MPSVTRLTPQRFMQVLKGHCDRHKSRGMRSFFSMEVYDRDGRPGGGGLGTLSSDWLQESADQGLPIIGVSIAHRYVQHQKFTGYWQGEEFADAGLEDNPAIAKLEQRVRVYIQGKPIPVSIFGKIIEGRNGDVVPVLLLSTADCGEMGFERITDRVYPGVSDWFGTLGQEIVLGMGGIRALRELDVPVQLYHFNDGHPSLAAAQILLDMGVTPERLDPAALNRLRAKIVYSSHTLVEAAADMFRPDEANNMIQDPTARRLIGMLGAQPVNGKLKSPDEAMVRQGAIDMIGMAMFSAGKIFAVSQLNAELLRQRFPHHADRIGGGITNAVNPSWVADPLARLYGEVAPGWKENPHELRGINRVRAEGEFRRKLWNAHMEAKLALIAMVKERREAIAKAGLDPVIFARDLEPEWLTVGFARRAASYKRHDLLAYDLGALAASIASDRPVQFVFAGKAHPKDEDPGGGKDILRKLLTAGEELNTKHPDKIRFIFLPDYDVEMARVLIPGVDLWLNNPIWGKEASGTSTMDAIANGVLLMTTDDGCIPEMRERGDIGWVFGKREHSTHNGNYEADSYALYAALSAASENFYDSMQSGAFKTGKPSLWINKMISAISQVAPYFLTPRMVSEYKRLMWGLD